MLVYFVRNNSKKFYKCKLYSCINELLVGIYLKNVYIFTDTKYTKNI